MADEKQLNYTAEEVNSLLDKINNGEVLTSSEKLKLQSINLSNYATINYVNNVIGNIGIGGNGGSTGGSTERVSVKDFGAIGDGSTNDKTAIQAAIDYCSTSNKVLTFECNKTYKCNSLKVPAGMKIDGNGAILKKPNLAQEYGMSVEEMKWVRLMSITGYDSAVDSEETIIQNLTFDGNCWTMWQEEDGWSQEQATLLFIEGGYVPTGSTSARNPGRVNLIINNCNFLDNVSDGIHVRQNVKANITNCKSKDCFRGGLTITGGNSSINVDNFIFESSSRYDGIDIEIDAMGYGDSYDCEVNLNNIVIDTDLDISTHSENSIVMINNLIMKKGKFSLAGYGETLINNSLMRYNSKSTTNYVQLLKNGKVRFANTKFEGYSADSCIHIKDYYESNEVANSLVEFDNCSFNNAKYGVSGGFLKNTVITFKGCYFDSGITDTAIGGALDGINFAPKTLIVSDCIFNNVGYYVKCYSVYEPLTEVYISNISIINPSNTGIALHSPIVVYNTVLLNGCDTHVTSGGSPKIFGNRKIILNNSPSNSMYGTKNVDTAVLKDNSSQWKSNGGTSWTAM